MVAVGVMVGEGVEVAVAVGVYVDVAVGTVVAVGVGVGVSCDGIVDGRAVTKAATNSIAPTRAKSPRFMRIKRETGCSESKRREAARLRPLGARSSLRSSATLEGRSSGCMDKLHRIACSVWGEMAGFKRRSEGSDLGVKKRCLASRGGCPANR